MFHNAVITPIDGGIVYAERDEQSPNALPLICIHGVGGHHRNFALLQAKFRERVPQVAPFFVDVPGFGNARDKGLSLRHIHHFLSAACTWIADERGRQVVVFQESAAVWFTIGLAENPAVDRNTVIVYNPVRVIRPSTTLLQQLLGKDVLDVRHEFLSRFFPAERIRKMDADELGRPSVPLAFLAELWKMQRKPPLDGWTRVVLIETRFDPLREFRISLSNTEVERYEIDSTQHGIGEDAVAQQTAEIVRHVLSSRHTHRNFEV